MLHAQIDVQWQMRSAATKCLFTSGVYRSFLIAPTSFSPHHLAAGFKSAQVRTTVIFGLGYRDASIASTRASPFPQQRGYSATGSDVSFDLDRLISPKKSSRWPQDPVQWIRFLEPYLPPALRNDSGRRKVRNIQDFKSIRGVSNILSRARNSEHGLDLLGYLGVGQKRWKAVIWLVKFMSSSYLHSSTKKEEQEILQASPWQCDSLDLHTLTHDPIWADDIIKPVSDKISQENPRDQNIVLRDGHEIDMDREVIGQIWQSTAFLILQAADNPLGDTRSNIIMLHVFEILAHLHHINAFPHSIYKYSPPADPFVPHKPPTLSLLSSQIMETLSDVEWRAQEYQTLSEMNWHETTKGNKERRRRQDLMADLNFHVPELSHGIWLDLILWACIEGGWISEAAWIVSAIDSRKHDPNIKWSVIRWDSLQHEGVPKMDWNMRLKLEFQRFDVNQQIGGIPRPGEGMQPCSINVPPRTISHEVIEVLIDALIISSSKIKHRADRIRRMPKLVGMCRNLLESNGQKLGFHLIDSALLRLIGPEGSAIMQTPELLDELLCLSREEVPAVPSPNLVNASANRDFTTDSAISVGLIHQLLYCFARLDFVDGALRSFQMAQNVSDMFSQQRLNDFYEQGKSSLLLMGNPSSLEDEKRHPKEGTSEFQISTPFKFRLPGYALVAFLEFVVRAELWELGKWLFYSNAVDGPTIPSNLYSNSHLQPALLHFATATADAQLLVKVTEKLKAPVSQSVLRALLHCQVAVGKWESVNDLLSYFRDEPGMKWDASDAMSIATSILRMECSTPKSDCSKSENISLAFGILQKLIAGEFNSAYSRAHFPDLTQFRLTIQIDRILRRIPGKLSTLDSQYSGDTERHCAPVDVSVEAFNMLMKCIVDCRGSTAGKALWDMWCREVWSLPASQKIPHVEGSELEQVIQPNLRTLRIILLPILRSYVDMSTYANDSGVKTGKLKSPRTISQSPQPVRDSDLSTEVLGDSNILSESERGILQWGITMYRKFGLTDNHLRAEFTTHLLGWQIADK